MTEGFKKELPTKEGYYKCLIHWREGCNTDDDNDYSIIGLYWINRSWHDFNNGGQEIDSIDYKVLGWCEAIPFNPWHTGIPTEDGDYLVAFRMSDNSVEYGWCNWNNGAWDILCDYDPTDGSCGMIAWQRIAPYKEARTHITKLPKEWYDPAEDDLYKDLVKEQPV